MSEKKSLGKGLSALFGDELNADDFGEKKEKVLKEIESQILSIPIALVKASPTQVRSFFDEEKLEELATSIKQFGIMEPLIVSKEAGKDEYQIIAGERRWRAAQKADLKEVPAIVRNEKSNSHLLEMMLVENIQREDLTPIEEASSYEIILERKKITQEQLSQVIGKSRAHIANLLRILKLPKVIQEDINLKKITLGHAKVLLSLEKGINLKEIVDEIISNKLSVRDLEKKIESLRQKKEMSFSKKKPQDFKNPHLQEIENLLREKLQTKVIIKKNSIKNFGVIEIEFYNDEGLESIVERIG